MAYGPSPARRPATRPAARPGSCWRRMSTTSRTTQPRQGPEEALLVRLHALRGVEIVDGVTRLAAMNLILHGVGPTGTEAEPPVKTDDSLRSDPGDRFDLVLTNPPFGKKSSVMVVNDFW